MNERAKTTTKRAEDSAPTRWAKPWVNPRTRPTILRAAAKRRRVREGAGLVADEHEAIHGSFGLSYAHYLVVPRSLLQSMPDEWQKRFVNTLMEMSDFGLDSPFTYSVKRRDDEGRFASDPFSDYRHVKNYTAADVERMTEDSSPKTDGPRAESVKGEPVG